MGQSVSGLKQEDIEAMMKATNCEHFFPIFPFFFSLSHITNHHVFFWKNAVTEYELRRLYRRFKKLDRDGSGTLTTDEFEAIPELSQNPLLGRLLSIFDKNKDEEIQFSEFVGTLATLSDKGSQDAKLRCLCFFSFSIITFLPLHDPLLLLLRPQLRSRCTTSTATASSATASCSRCSR